MRLEDIPEAVSACCCSVDDELRIKEMADEVVQVRHVIPRSALLCTLHHSLPTPAVC